MNILHLRSRRAHLSGHLPCSNRLAGPIPGSVSRPFSKRRHPAFLRRPIRLRMFVSSRSPLSSHIWTVYSRAGLISQGSMDGRKSSNSGVVFALSSIFISESRIFSSYVDDSPAGVTFPLMVLARNRSSRSTTAVTVSN